MQKPKAKRTHWLARRLPFAVLWALAGIVVATLTNAFLATRPSEYLTPQQITFLISLWNVVAVALIRIQLVERLLKRSMRGWLVYTLIATTISLFGLNLIVGQRTTDSQLTRLLGSFMYLLPNLILQTVWFWPRVHKAWLLPLISIIFALGFHGLYSASPASIESPWVQGLGVLSSVIMGAVIHYLWSHPKDAEKTKVDFAADEDSDSDNERLSRLQEQERHTPLWDIGDDQALQSEA